MINFLLYFLYTLCLLEKHACQNDSYMLGFFWTSLSFEEGAVLLFFFFP